MTNSIADVMDSDVIFIIGSNADTSHPTIGLRLHQAAARGAKLLVADPRGTDFAHMADIWMRVNPGSDVALLNGMMHVILEEDLWDKEFVAERTENLEEVEIVTAKYTPAYVEEITGIGEEQLRQAARLYASPGKRCSIFYGMGLAHHATGTDNVKSVANLAMLCGKLGVPGGGINPLRGQNNVQGACDMGALFNTLPGYSGLDKDDIFDKYEKLWGVTLPRRKGKAATEVWDGIMDGEIHGLYIMGEDPVLADPNALHAVRALEKIDLLVVQDIFMTETAKMATVVFPAACYAEKDGTFTSTERMVQRVRKVVDPPGEARPDWRIIRALSEKMGYQMNYKSAEDIFNEIASLLPQYAGITYPRLEKTGLQWPVPDQDHPGTPVLHVGKFTKGKGLFIPEDFTPPREMPDGGYPLMLTTVREAPRYNFDSMTGKTKCIDELCPECLAELNPVDAEKYGIEDRTWIRITSRRGSVTVRAAVNERTQLGTVTVPYHYAAVPINNLTLNDLDPLSRSPQYKICSIKVEIVKEEDLS